MSSWFPTILAFAVGFAMKYGGLCTYAAARQLVNDQRFDRLHAFLAATAFSSLLLLPVSWFGLASLNAGSTHAEWQTALLAGLVLGAGAWFNRGCIFGTFVQLTGGNLNYLATLVGVAGGASLVRFLFSSWTPPMVRSAPALSATAFAVAAVILALVMVMPLLRRQRMSRLMVALILGAGGGWLFASIRGWDFAAVFTRWVYFWLGLEASAPTRLAIQCTLAMVAGGLLASFWRNRFALKRLNGRLVLGCLTGGALMGGAAVVLPGGNDSLVLAGLPVLAPHALIGYAGMLAALLALVALKRN